jgi:hypothetical protein
MRNTKLSGVFWALTLVAALAIPLAAQTNGPAVAGQEAAAVAGPVQASQAAQAKPDSLVVKSYELKYIGATEFMRSARFYVMDSTGTEKSLTVRILSSQIPAFEALLKKLDVEKKNVQFKVYTIMASQQEPQVVDPKMPAELKAMIPAETKEFADKELKKVLDEMKGLWNFKYFWVDSPSFLLAKDGSGANQSKLVGQLNASLVLENVQLRGEDAGKRVIAVGRVVLTQKTTQGQESLINTSDITFKENGYLVVGVSGMSETRSGRALILVINAEVK